jgi:hypothetical protein
MIPYVKAKEGYLILNEDGAPCFDELKTYTDFFSVEKGYGPEIGEWLALQYFKNSNECDYIDNVRVADYYNKKEMEIYNKQKDKGCCGSVDLSLRHPKSNRFFMLGWNYGH